MDAARFDRWTRRTVGQSLGRTAGGLAALLLGASAPPAMLARAKKGKRKKKRKKRGPPPEPTCVDSCGDTCLYCFHRPLGPPLCGDGRGPFSCEQTCLSDNDCVDVSKPYCITHRTERGTGERRRWECGAAEVAVCVSVLSCTDLAPRLPT
jgi:hypothetical protein